MGEILQQRPDLQRTRPHLCRTRSGEAAGRCPPPRNPGRIRGDGARSEMRCGLRADRKFSAFRSPQRAARRCNLAWRAGPRRRGPRSGSEISLANARSEEHTSELQSLMRISYAVFCLKKKNKKQAKKANS